MNQINKPHVIGIGSRRCGSSWLHECLNSHVQIEKPKKGVHFFSDNYYKGEEWYLKQFDDYDQKNKIVEFSVSYGYKENADFCAKNISRMMNSCKIFIVVRNPIDRAYSDYRRSMQLLEFPKNTSFKDALLLDPRLLERGKYGEIISTYLKYFDIENLLILDYSELSSSPQLFINKLLTFIGVSTDSKSYQLPLRKRSEQKVRFYLVMSFIYKIKNILKKILFVLFGKHASRKIISKSMPLYQLIIHSNQKHDNSAIDNETYNMLENYYSTDIAILENITKTNYQHWLKRK